MIKQEVEIIFWDNDGTIIGSMNPNSSEREILPGVREAMSKAEFNFIISGIKSPERQNFVSELIRKKFIKLMNELPINAVAFSPKIGGTACYYMTRNNNQLQAAHEEEKYKELIGDSFQDQAAAESFGIPFIHANSIHTEQPKNII